jgi:hypothetical protein
MPKIVLDGEEFNPPALTADQRDMLQKLTAIDAELKEKHNIGHMLELARKYCMQELKREILAEKSGLFLGDD